MIPLLLLALAGCGGRKPATTIHQGPRSVTEVKSAFAQHGIELHEWPLKSPFHTPFTQLDGSAAGIKITVEVYRAIPSDYVVWFPENGTPHSARAQNVVVSWSGRDLPAIRAALAGLR